MNPELDIEIYSTICDRLNASEIYLGHAEQFFIYTKTEYNATCTEAFPFNPFDKVVCELLQVENNLSFYEIGKILGLNVGSVGNEKEIKDNAEYEILMEALQSLADFNMIEGGDIYFSKCRLTAIGKEYSDKKYKFKKTDDKPFTIFFDKTTGNHKQAKANFEFAKGAAVPENAESPILDDFNLKEIASVQVPEIYNPAKLYSFTDEIVVDSENLFIIFPVGITFDVKNEKFIFYCYDESTKRIHVEFSRWILNSDKITSELLDELRINYPHSLDTTSDFNISLKGMYPDGKLKASINEIIDLKYIDQYLVFSNLDLLIVASEKNDFYLSTPILTDKLLSSVKRLIQKSENLQSRFFIVLPNLFSPLMRKEVKQLIEISLQVSNLYIIQQDMESFLIISNNEIKPFYIELKDIVINEFLTQIAVRKSLDTLAIEFQNNLLSIFSDKLALSLCSNANEIIIKGIDSIWSREELNSISGIEFKLLPFINIGEQAKTVEMTLDLIADFKKQKIQLLNERLQQQLKELLGLINTANELQELTQLKKSILALEEQMVVNDSSLVSQIALGKSLLEAKEEIIQEQKRIYSFIIDTNILLEDPEVILRVDKKHAIIIAAKVLDELDKFKMDKNLSFNVSRAVKIIQQDKNRNIRHNKGRPKLLPPDLNQKTPDNLILSVAVQYHNNYGILITSDNLLSVKAQNILDLKVMNLQEFKTKFDQSIKS